MNVALPLLIVFGNCVCCWGVCTYPSALIGEWYSTSFGTLHFETNQSFSGFTSALHTEPLNFTCFESSGSQYVSRSSYILFSDILVEVYLCINLQEVSTVKYYYTLDGNLDTGTGIRFYSPVDTGGTITVEQVCSFSDTRSPGEYELLIKKDQLSSAVTSCPDEFQSTFDVTITTTSNDTNCTGSMMEGSTGDLVFNFSSCVSGQFNSGGYLQCLYSKTDGYSYATLYNNDTTTDGSSTYQYTCLTYEKDGATLRATESPSSCHLSQTPTSVNSPGVTYVMTDLLYTPEEKKKDNTTVIIIVVCCILGVIIIIIIIVIIILYFKVCRKPQPEPPPKIRKKKRKLSITEYTPRSLGRGSSVEKLDEGVINKKSTEEIITGLTEDKKDKHVLLNGDAYEPPKKQAWQTKWETVRNNMSPRLTQDTLRRMRQSFPSDGGISRLEELSVSDLDKAYTLSTSLPESIDIPFKESNKSVNFNAAVKTPVTPKYTERSHATPSIPASTGKFGGSPNIRSTESIHMPNAEPKLDTITENPLSRENTGISQKISPTKTLKEHPNLTRILNGGDVTALSTVLTSNSTASGWQYKWEKMMRPKKILSEIKHHIQRSQTPVKLFQNIVTEETRSTSAVNKVVDDQDEDIIDKVTLIDNESDNRNERKSVEKMKEECVSKNDLPDVIANTNLDQGTSTTCDTSSKTSFSIVDEKESKTHKLSLKRSNKKSKEALSGRKRTAACVKKKATLPRSISNKGRTNSANNICGDCLNTVNDDSLNLDKERHDDSGTPINDQAEINETNILIDIAEATSVTLRSESIQTLEQVEFDSVSLHSGLFFPDDWLYQSSSALDQIWKIGAKGTLSKKKREYNQYIGTDEDMIQKKEISPFKKIKTDSQFSRLTI